MENSVTVFNYEESKFDVIMIEGEPWFIGKQVAAILGYEDTKKAIKLHVDVDDRQLVDRLMLTNGSSNRGVNCTLSNKAISGINTSITIINESGLYSLILSSKLDGAKKFKKWVTSEVLPSIRKTGVYELTQNQETEEQLIARALVAANNVISRLQNRVNSLKEMVVVKDQQIAEMNPKADYYDLILRCPDLVTTTVIAQDYGMSAQELNKTLKDLEVQWKQGKTWVLRKKYVSEGYTKTKTHYHKDSEDIEHATVHMYWTQKGRLFIYQLLKENGILPLIERER